MKTIFFQIFKTKQLVLTLKQLNLVDTYKQKKTRVTQPKDNLRLILHVNNFTYSHHYPTIHNTNTSLTALGAFTNCNTTEVKSAILQASETTEKKYL